MHEKGENEIMSSKLLKKLASATLIGGIVLSLAGCVRYKTTASVKKDGTCDISVLYATVDMSSSIESDDPNVTVTTNSDNDEDKEVQMKKFKDLGWTVEDYLDDKNEDQKYIGYTLTKEGIALEELADELADLPDMGFEKFTLEKDGDNYIIDWDVSSSQKKAEGNQLESGTLKMSGGYMQFELELPNDAKEHNAYKEDEGVYTWNILDMKEPIHCEFSLKGGNGFPMWLIGVIAGGVVIIAGVVVAIIIMSKRKKNDPSPAAAAPAPAAPSNNAFSPAPSNPAFAPAPKEEPAPFTPAQNTGLPQVGVVPPAPETPEKPSFAGSSEPEIASAPTANAPLWATPSAASQVDSLEELEALEEEPMKPILPDVIPTSTAPTMAPFAPLSNERPGLADMPDTPQEGNEGNDGNDGFPSL